MTVTDQVRDLDVDLAFCEAATPGRWTFMDVSSNSASITFTGASDSGTVANIEFIAAARRGWPYAIRRLQEAEDKIDRLENELRMLQDAGRCWD